MHYEQLLKAGVHFGHLTRKWNPRMAPYIFMERHSIHIIDLYQTIKCLEEAAQFAEQLSLSGKKILFVGTKMQAKEIIEQEATRLRMPYVSERWLGGMLTNFTTIRRSMRRMQSMNKLMREPAYKNLAKRERLMLQRDKEKRQKMLGGILDLTRLPDALFIVDINKEKIATQEAQSLNIPIIAMVDTNCNPTSVDYPIPANDDSIKSIETIIGAMSVAVSAGTSARKKAQKEAQQQTSPEETDPQSSKEKSEDNTERSASKRRRMTVSAPVSEKSIEK